MKAEKVRLVSFWCVCGGVRGIYCEGLRRIECVECHRTVPDDDGSILAAIEVGATLKYVGVRRNTGG